MATAGHNRPIIVKRRKVINEAGHHGGAWKVAYADFVTAMMAFFMLMWLLNATTEDQRKGIADYFNPTVPIFRVSGGGDGATRGESILAEQDKAESGQRGEPDPERDPQAALRQAGTGASPFWQEVNGADALEQVEELLEATGGESAAADRLLRHIRTRVTDEGLIVELFDLPDSPLFAADTATPLERSGHRRAYRRPARRAGRKSGLAAVLGAGRGDARPDGRIRLCPGAAGLGGGPRRPPAGRSRSHGDPQQPAGADAAARRKIAPARRPGSPGRPDARRERGGFSPLGGG